MASTIGVNVVMKGDNSDLVSKANEAKRAMDFINTPSAGSPFQTSVQNGSNDNTGVPVNNNGFAGNGLLEINKALLEEIKNISKFLISGKNGNPTNPLNPSDQPTGKDFTNKLVKGVTKGVTTGLSIASSVISGVLNYDTGTRRITMAERQGDVFGADIGRKDRATNTVKGASTGLNVAGSLLGLALGGPAGALVGNALAEGLNNIINSTMNSLSENEKAKLEEKKQVTEIYKSRMRLNERSMLLYNGSDADINTASHNANTGLHLQKFARNYSVNTGMSLDEFQALMNNMSSYGVKTHSSAGEYARASALMTTYTGEDTSGLYGLSARLGMNANDADKSIRKAYGASLASGLSKGQFGEFLTGLQNAVEEGISQGFVRSTDDVSKTMVMMSKLSGGDAAWEGKYGFAKLSQMNQGLKNATNLQNTSSLLAFQSLRGLNDGSQGAMRIDGQDALNTLALMEKGFDASNFGAISKRFSSQYGNDVMENVLAWKNLTGLNYNGAMKLYEMQKNYEKNGSQISQKEIDNLMARPEYNSDQKNELNYLNSIASNTAILGETGFRNYIQKLSEISAEHSIYEDSESFEVNTENGMENKKNDPNDYRVKSNRKYLRAEDYELYKTLLQAQDNPETMELAISKLKDILVYDNEMRSKQLKDLIGELSEALRTSEVRFEMGTD